MQTAAIPSHLFHLNELNPHNSTEGGTRTKATKRNFPLLNGMSLYKLSLNPRAIREPHWHANADELGYCLKGSVLVSFYATSNTKSSFLVQPGESFLIPSGALHDIENIANEAAELILQFNHEEPEDFALSSTLSMFSNSVLGNTWSVADTVFSSLQRSAKQEKFAVMSQTLPSAPAESRYHTVYRYNLEGASPLISNAGGSARVARHDVWPVLKRQALYSLRLSGAGMREPHWHPETAEMGYVHKGKGRMSILSPSGDLDTYVMNAGDLYFIPKAYPHHIENLTNDELHLLIFFDQPMPADIGFTGSIKSFSNNSLASVMNTSPSFFDNLPTYYEDLFIVKKLNPVD